MTHLVLGSASAGRLSVLRKAGVEPTVIVSDVDEDAVLAAVAGAAPEVAVAALARAKADAVAAQVPAFLAADCVVIGCDSMLLLDGRLCGKPGTPERARAQWRAMAGQHADLLTGHALIRLRDGVIDNSTCETACTTVHFGQPSDSELEAYLASGEPLGVAGGFTLDGLGGWFIDRIDGDPSNVIGLSLPLVRRLLAGLGVSIADVWP
ncbi:Maf-like protein [Mycolicibacterium insubricum]|uniref:Nucleoside triphosphate pyrophosphatase n=1 Tax=Mycolicibacterium insubricum TaxID=444597 RepID=A0A1X0D186_9MYCO|nr:nucleoside triphosphate pyrophosphatase [Mycolicibacterium insubricum]MCB9440410.1 septum formation inhibitor Maf [Mycolicibacterium sp.]ORA66095.1 septum formation inhibitor Maf [Mycolicibacterium insubricum]BBZ66153.1 Maf-like protein [Mycolicibacterium insubricum]